jgi:hypothetical protein
MVGGTDCTGLRCSSTGTLFFCVQKVPRVLRGTAEFPCRLTQSIEVNNKMIASDRPQLLPTEFFHTVRDHNDISFSSSSRV